MLTATGVGARRNPDGTVTVKVSVADDRSKQVSIKEYVGKDLQTLKQQIADELKALDTANDDDVLQAAVAGVILATSKGVEK